MFTPWRLFLCQMVINISYHVAKASLCLGGSDMFATVMENSPTGVFIANLSIVGDPVANSIRLCLSGENADWFFLEGRTIRLNSSFSRALDREVQGSVLMAALTCYENDTIQSEYRITVEILNENDNRPYFLQKTIQPFHISELTAVNSVVFTVKAIDADGDTITYVIDQSSRDASYFRINLPNSGRVILTRPLDYESKTQLELVIYAVESNTREKYNTTASLTVNVLDGDDQYPQFLPCTLISQDHNHTVCTNPVYTVNITEEDQDMMLIFSPGPIRAEDGDRRLDTPLLYTILSGADHGRFLIDNQTGEITLTRRVENRQLTPIFRLRVMASQLNDPKKYSVSTVLVRVLAENRFPPLFNKTTYKGFIIESFSPATLVSTYGNKVLLIQAIDLDFKYGVNPKIHYSLQHVPDSNGLYHITQEGVLIAKTDQLRAFERHILEVVATDEESGEVATASVDIEVLQRGQPVPRGPFGEERLFGDMDMRMAGGIAGGALLLLVAVLFLLLQLLRRRRDRHDPAVRGAIPLGKHPNVVNSSQPTPLFDEVCYLNEAFSGDYQPSGPSGSLHGRHGHYTRKISLPAPPPRFYGGSSRPISDMLPILGTPEPLPGDPNPALLSNVRTDDKTPSMGAGMEVGTLEEEEEEEEEQPSEGGRMEGEAVHVLALVQRDAGETPAAEAAGGTTQTEREEPQSDTVKTKQTTEPKDGQTPHYKTPTGAQEAGNPYKDTHSGICDEDGPCDGSSYYGNRPARGRGRSGGPRHKGPADPTDDPASKPNHPQTQQTQQPSQSLSREEDSNRL